MKGKNDDAAPVLRGHVRLVVVKNIFILPLLMKKFLLLPFCVLALTSCLNNADFPQLTECLNKNQIVMFGASWCPHCAAQKQLFGRSVKNMPYFECSQNGTQVKECDDRGIMSYPTWQFQEKTLEKLPKEALLNLLNTEIEKVRSTSKMYIESSKDKPELLKTIKDFDAKTEKMIGSDMSDFEKLKKLTVLSENENNTLDEKPVYTAGRIAGERALSDIALYAGCSTEYQNDITATKK